MDFIANIDVDDSAKAIRFYGAAVGRRFGASGAEMLCGQTSVELMSLWPS